MQNTARAPLCDTCDRRLTFANTPGLSESQRRFLDAYRQRLGIAAAARSASVHRATVYRWRKDPIFTAAMKAAAEDFFREHKAKVLEQEAARRRWRDERERERRPMRCVHLTRARAAKRR